MKKIFAILMIILSISLTGCGAYFDNSENTNTTTYQAETISNVLKDGVIQETNIFTIETQLKSIEGYNWSDDHCVIEGRTGYFGTCLCEEKDIWCDLYGDDNKEITLASIDVFEEDYELLIDFVSFFDTSLINASEVQQWLRDSKSHSESSKIFGDAEYSLFFGETEDNKYSLYITALE